MECAHLGGQWAWSVEEVTADPHALDAGGRWAIVLPYSGEPTFIRFGQWSPTPPPDLVVGPWVGPAADSWTSSADAAHYIAAVEQTRAQIAAGDVYQVNVCRVLSAHVGPRADLIGLHALLLAGNPAPYAGMVRLGELQVVTASPELFLFRDGSRLLTSPIKGTAAPGADFLEKDDAENVMIVDLMRNDLSRVCLPGSVEVPGLLRREEHPGLVHLVSDVEGRLREDVGWADILEACFPPGSVTGAPKLSAVRIIEALEPVSRQIYCGAIGWVDAETRTASLAVAIRTFWRDGDWLRFGTGAGITWGSDAAGEWAETELKAARLCAVAGGVWQGGVP